MKISQDKGFTLIELVVVIVILAILAVVAVPKFINLQKEAQTAVIHGLAAALKDATKLVYAKSVFAGVETLEFDDSETPSVVIDSSGTTVPLDEGYPLANWEGSLEHILHLDATSWDYNGYAIDPTAEWVYSENYENSDDNMGIEFFPRGYTLSVRGAIGKYNCYVRYNLDDGKFGYMFEVRVDGC
ncbi:MAG: prepilin-type N-terminal cleavage/methylation domain-containing protein [Shewanella sp.]